MTRNRPLSEQGKDDATRYRAYAIVRRLFAAMDDADDRWEAEKTFPGEGLEALARDVVDAIPILFKGCDGRTPARIAMVFAEEMIRRARPADEAAFQPGIDRACLYARSLVNALHAGDVGAACVLAKQIVDQLETREDKP